MRDHRPTSRFSRSAADSDAIPLACRLASLCAGFGAALSALVLTASIAATPAGAVIHLIASTTDLGSIASNVGGDQVEVKAIARPGTDVHRVEVLPSYMVKVAGAQVYLKVGLSLDQWADGIIDGSHNDRLIVADCSDGIDVLEKPTGGVNASMGDVHPNGNPHYWLDPRNGAIIAHTIAAVLTRADPSHTAEYAARADAFARRVEDAYAEDGKALADLPSHNIVTYHASWVYLAHAFALDVVGNVEPVPGIPPTAKHLADLIDVIKTRRVKAMIQEPYFSDDAGRFLAREAGVRVIKAAPSCESVDPLSYLDHFRDLVKALVESGI
jgi:zinc/manganese transport system substrate-binding protein